MKKVIFINVVLVFAMILIGLPAFAQERFGGLSLYTVRNEMGTDPKGTLKKVADTGYKFIEAADYNDGKFYGMSPEEFKKELANLKLTPLSAHMGSVTLNNADKQIADVKAVGFKYFVAPIPPMGLFQYDPATKSLSMSEDVATLVSILDKLGQKCQAAGLDFLYHNHGFEFEENKNGIIPIEYMLKNLDAKYVNFQMDLYWVVKVDADPISYFEKYPGRFVIWHLKDMDDQGRFAPLGTGSIDFKTLQTHKNKAGMKYYIVEQDQTYDSMEPLEAIKISHGSLKEFGFN